MATPNRKPARRRRYRVNLIKATYLYDTNEIAKLFHIHRNTVRQWLKGGLDADRRSPAGPRPWLRPQGVPRPTPRGAAAEMRAGRVLLLPVSCAAEAVGQSGGRLAAHGKDREAHGDLLRLRDRDAQDDSSR